MYMYMYIYAVIYYFVITVLKPLSGEAKLKGTTQAGRDHPQVNQYTIMYSTMYNVCCVESLSRF